MNPTSSPDVDVDLALSTARLKGAARIAPDERVRLLALARTALGAAQAGRAALLLAEMGRLAPADAEVALLCGVALRHEQRLAEAAQVFARARAAGAADPRLIEGLAQTRYELGQPAAALFGEALHVAPDNLDVAKNHAAALAAEGDAPAAEALLTSALATNPGWIDGHKALATLHWTRGDPARFADSYAAAVQAEPANADLWLAWFRALAQTRDWVGAGAVLDQAERALGASPALLVSRLFIASESGDAVGAARLLEQTAGIEGETINLCRVRHHLRQGRQAEAESVCLRYLLTPSATLFWPYLSLAWRLAQDPRHLWLDRPDVSIQPREVELSTAELAELAELLRALHVMERPYVEQSVRGGTQTDRSVILRHEPIIARARTAWLEAIRRYIADLPPFEQGHPLLGCPRGELLIEGSWSVRLLRQGYNVPHNHPMGWLSTAWYVALPGPDQLGPAPAGHIAFGTPPEELGLDLPAYCTIEPRIGRTAIFPSTMWHRTMPFDDGERLVIALDVRRPRH
ncbi:MAG: hypothetical protein HOO94_05695 [Novosphingobium sp.]|nr:hypothetical protein [Novosphingobium sp.]